MFFILSKLLQFIINPAFWLILLVIIAALTKKDKRRKRIIITTVILFLFFSNNVIFSKIIVAWQPAPTQIQNVYPAGIVLGGFSSFDKKGNGFLNSNCGRFIATANLYHQGYIKKVIVSGGNGYMYQSTYKEADFAKKMFIQNGIPEADILVENRSRNTYENATYSKQLIDSLHMEGPFILITSAMHIPRAEKTFEKAGIPVTTFPCAYIEIDSKKVFSDYFFPDFNTFSQWQFFLKELAGIAMYRFSGKC